MQYNNTFEFGKSVGRLPPPTKRNNFTRTTNIIVSMTGVDLLLVYFQKTTNKREPKLQQNRSEEEGGRGTCWVRSVMNINEIVRRAQVLSLFPTFFLNRFVASLIDSKMQDVMNQSSN